MAQFAWTGRDAAQALRSGVVEAASAAQAADAVLAMSLTPVSIQPHESPVDARATLTGWFSRGRVDDETLMIFSRQMHALLRAGVPILRALAGLAASTEDPRFAEVLKKLRSGLDAGHELSQLMARHGEVFDNYYAAMVRVGEQTGRLPDIFRALHDHLAFQRSMREKVASALRYPKFVVLAMLAALLVIHLMVIPQFAAVFRSLHAELPLMTRVLLGTSELLLTAWPWLLMLAAALWLAWRTWRATDSGQLTGDRLLLRLPLAGRLLSKTAMARTCAALALMQRSGVPTLQALTHAAEVVQNRHIELRVKGMRQAIERGDNLLAAASRAGVFSPLVLQMVMVGEESGTLDEMLGEVAALYQHDVERDLGALSQRLEPFLVVVLGAMLLVLALGVFLPMWELGSAAIR